jgi:hypothetical protein
MFHRIVYGLMDLVSKIAGKVFFPRRTLPSAIILRHYKNNPGFRASLVEEIVARKTHPRNTRLSTDELLAVLSIWLTQEPINEVFTSISTYDSEWTNLFDNHFFEQLSRTAATWRYKGLSNLADNLIKTGKHIAEFVQNDVHAKNFNNEIFQRQHDKDKDNINYSAR